MFANKAAGLTNVLPCSLFYLAILFLTYKLCSMRKLMQDFVKSILFFVF